MSKIRVGILGAGGRGIYSFGYLFTTLFRRRVEIVALADPCRERAAAGAAYLGIAPAIHANVHDLLIRKDIDAVVVTSPDYLHEELCIAAFRHGKHVLVDKPLAISAKGCLRVIEASRRAKKLLYMGFNLRHDAVLRRLKTMVADGTFGELFSLQAVEYYDGGRTYMSRWNRLKKYSGGLFIHKGSHDFDILNWFMGRVRPFRVSCFANVFTFNREHLPFKPRPNVRPGPTCSACPYQRKCPDVFLYSKPVPGPGAAAARALGRMFSRETAHRDGYRRDLCMYLSDKDTHDQGIALIEYQNGATAAHSEYFATPLTDRRYLLEGTVAHGEASLHANRIRVQRRWSRKSVLHNVRRPVGSHGGADPHMCMEFVNCIRKGIRPSASGVDGAWSVAIGEACELARVEGRVVKISEVLDTASPLLK